MPVVDHFECSRCQQHVSAEKYQTVCPACAGNDFTQSFIQLILILILDCYKGALYVRYDIENLKSATRPNFDSPPNMWRYADVLPKVDAITLGEGWTPMLKSRRYPIYIKEEATNPTGSFKARGMSMAISMARFYGIRKLAAPSVI